MSRNWLRIALLVLCIGLVQCTGSTTTTSGPPTAFATLRLNATDGTGDVNFAGGKTIMLTSIDPSLVDFALALAFQPADNKIVVAGSNGLAGQGQIALVRYTADGLLDTTTFGASTGIVKTSLASPALASAVAVQPADGKIVVAALLTTADSTSATGFTTSIVVLRYNTDGTLDSSFGANGTTTVATPIGSGLAGDTCAMLLQTATGNIVVAGASQDGKLVLARYTPTGVVDTAFGTLGTTVTSLAAPSSSPTHTSPAMAAQSDGRIIVVTRNADDQAVLRFSADGAPDTTFGGATNGIVTTDIGGTVNYADAVAIQSTGDPGNLDKIVVAGHTSLTESTSDIALVRYSKDGVLDTSGVAGTGFGTTGIVTTDINGQFDNALGVALQDLGGGEPRILVSGNTGFGGSTQIMILRYNANGTPDTTFGSAMVGQVFAPVVGPSTIASGNKIAIQPGKGIVVSGYD